MWFALVSGSALFIGFFVALPVPLIVSLACLIALCALGLTVEEAVLARRHSCYVSGWRTIGRFVKKVFLLLP
jgi:hypothetical protein